MQPPPRKVKTTVALKNTHCEHIAKLQSKHQLEFDILEDIRAFSKQRSTIEKEYAQALLKLSSQYLTKKDFPVKPEEENEDDAEFNQRGRLLTTVWKTVLQETEACARSRLQASETYLQKVSEPARIIKANKAQLLDKTMESLRVLHAEISQTVREMAKAKKLYGDDEKEACDARQKATEAEERLKKKSTGIFQSMATLQRNTAKLFSRREMCESKSLLSRNEYLLTMHAANAHQSRYFTTDLPELMTVLDGNVYNRCQDFFKLLGETEKQCCETTVKSCDSILSDAILVSREYNLNQFLKEYPVFTETVQYEFEPWDHDPVTSVSGDTGSNGALVKETKKWAGKVAKENKLQRDCTRNLKTLQAQGSIKFDRQSSASSDSGKSDDPEQKIEDLKNQIRKSETAKLKAEARLEALRQAGVNVDEWLNYAFESLLQEDDDISRTSSQMSIQTNSSEHSEEVDQHPESTYISYDNDFIDDTFDTSFNSSFQDGGIHYPCYCTVLYDFQGSNVDELDLVANEQLELISSGEGDGWLRARNSEGKVGYVPENYIEIEADQTLQNTDGDIDVRSSYSSTDYEVQAHVSGNSALPPADGSIWARALYDYQGVSDEELSFGEGQLIKILRKDENGVDDGFWEGELNGKVGVFPSLVVEELEPRVNGVSHVEAVLSNIGDDQPDTELAEIPTQLHDVATHYDDATTQPDDVIAQTDDVTAQCDDFTGQPDDFTAEYADVTINHNEIVTDSDHASTVYDESNCPTEDYTIPSDETNEFNDELIGGESSLHETNDVNDASNAQQVELGTDDTESTTNRVYSNDGCEKTAGNAVVESGGDCGDGTLSGKPVPATRVSVVLKSSRAEKSSHSQDQGSAADDNQINDDSLEFNDESLEESCV